MSLLELVKTGKYNTDKEVINGVGRHSYVSGFYDKEFQQWLGRNPNILELGVYHGGSLKLWRDYFGKDAKIIGVDINTTPLECCADLVMCGDAYEPATADSLGVFDIIIDDADHHPDDQELALRLYLPHLKPGGVYIVEDVQHEIHVEQLRRAVPAYFEVQVYDGSAITGAFDDRLFIIRKPADSSLAGNLERHRERVGEQQPVLPAVVVGTAVQVPPLLKMAICMTESLQGWCPPAKAFKLAELVLTHKPETVVEVGVFGGRSAIPLAMALKHVGKGRLIAIDAWDMKASVEGETKPNADYWATIDCESVYRGFLTAVTKYDLEDYVTVHKCRSDDAPLPPVIDMLHLDGNHAAQAVIDIKRYAPRMADKGIVIMDDLSWSGGHVRRASYELLALGYREIHADGDWGVFQR